MSTQQVLVTPAKPFRRLTPTIWQCIGRAIWRGLEEFGQRRASRELLAMAERAQRHDPALAAQLRMSAHFGSMT